MIRAVLFDLDGTLLNTLGDIAGAMNRALLRHGLPAFEVEEYRYMVGNGAVKLAERATRANPALREAVLQDYMADYAAHSLVSTAPYAGVPELLAALKGRGLRLAVVSNKPDADTRAVIRHFFGGVFDLVRGQQPAVPLKPDPTAVLAAASALAVPPAEWLYLGDSAVDMTCAGRAGMHGVGVTWGFREEKELREAGAEDVIHAPMDLMNLPALSG